MNFSFYIFNYSEGRYDQFPLDETHALFKGFIETREDRAQLTVYRRQRLISYTYIQEYDGVKSCFGFSLVFNGVYCRNIERLFKVFVDAISGEAGNESKLIRYGEEQRKIIFTDEKLYSLLPEIDHFRESVKQEIETMRSDFFPVDTSFDCNNTAEKQLCILDGNEMINAALRKYRQLTVTSEDRIAQKRRKRIRRISYTTVVLVLLLNGFIAYHYIDRKRRIDIAFCEARAKTIEYFDNQIEPFTALDFCNKALEIKPGNQEMEKLKIQIEAKIEEQNKQRFNEIRQKALDFFDFAQKTDANYFYTVLNLCDSALSINPGNEEIKQLKVKIAELIKKL